MFFFVDESGNTGNNLFDPNQPNLYYGVLGGRTNLDITARPMVERLRRELGTQRLHANQLGVGRLIPVAEAFTAFQKKNDIRFHFYTVVKADHAVISFFDQVFDAGMNEAVPQRWYWTPLRYVLLMNVAELFDDGLRRAAWTARLELTTARCEEKLKKLCEALGGRLNRVPDEYTRTLIDAALKWVIAHAGEIQYGAADRAMALQISPNLVGFQQVWQGIASHAAKMDRVVRSITVDRQNEFNDAQEFIADVYSRLRGTELARPPGMPTFDWNTMPTRPPEFRAGDDSVGLEMVDIYLWITKRAVEGRALPAELNQLLYGQRSKGVQNEVSLAGIDRRWAFLRDLPEPQA